MDPRKVNNHRYTDHVLQRMSERGITKDMIRQAIKFGEVSFLKRKWRVRFHTLTVYLTADGAVIKTAYLEDSIPDKSSKTSRTNTRSKQ